MSKLLAIFINARTKWLPDAEAMKARNIVLSELGFRYRGVKGVVSHTVNVPENKPDAEARVELIEFMKKCAKAVPDATYTIKEWTTADRDNKAAKESQHAAEKRAPKASKATGLDALSKDELIALLLKKLA